MICKDEQLQLFLNELEDLQSSSYSHDSVFIVGAPRAGTTVVNQALSYCTDIGYIDNLIAKFHWNPALGVKYSQDLGIARVWSGESDYGRTTNIGEPHEFGAFWRRVLNADNMLQPKCSPDFTNLHEELASICTQFDRPVLFKAFQLIWFIREFHQQCAKAPKWITITRGVYDNALSLLRLRATRGDLHVPQSLTPFSTMKYHCPYDQVVDQVTSINKYIEHQISYLPENSLIRVKYEEFCSAPKYTLNTVIDSLDCRLDEEALGVVCRDILERVPTSGRGVDQFEIIHRERLMNAVENVL